MLTSVYRSQNPASAIFPIFPTQDECALHMTRASDDQSRFDRQPVRRTGTSTGERQPRERRTWGGPPAPQRPRRQLVGSMPSAGWATGKEPSPGAYRMPILVMMRTTQSAGTQVASKGGTTPTPKPRVGQASPEGLPLSVFPHEPPFESR